MLRLLLSLHVIWADAQSYGSGFGKATFSVSDGMGVYNWLNKYLPIQPDVPNGEHECGALGRVLAAAAVLRHGGFGIHAVSLNSSSARIHKAEGCPAIADIEHQFDSKWSKVVDGGAYDPFLDYNVGFWVSSLDKFIATFNTYEVPKVKLSWKDMANNITYYSVIVRVDSSMMLIELMSGDCSLCTGGTSPVLAVPAARFVFAVNQSPHDLWGFLDAGKALLHPARLSWPSSNASREREFFSGLGVDLVGTKQSEGIQTDIYDFAPLYPAQDFESAQTMQFHVVQRADDGSSFTWADYEATVMNCHRATIKDDLCGENPFMDNHIGFNAREANKLDAGIVKKLSTDLGLPFHATPSANAEYPFAVYAMAGNGLSITFQLAQGSYTPPRTRTGHTSLDLCSNGNCAGLSTRPSRTRPTLLTRRVSVATAQPGAADPDALEEVLLDTTPTTVMLELGRELRPPPASCPQDSEFLAADSSTSGGHAAAAAAVE